MWTVGMRSPRKKAVFPFGLHFHALVVTGMPGRDDRGHAWKEFRVSTNEFPLPRV